MAEETKDEKRQFTTPKWFENMVTTRNAGVGHVFALWGNIFDVQKLESGEYVDLKEFLLHQLVEDYPLIMTYSISKGLNLASRKMLSTFDELTGKKEKTNDAPATRGKNLMAEFTEAFRDLAVPKPSGKNNSSSVNELLGEKDPEIVLPWVERILQKENFQEIETTEGKKTVPLRKIFIIEYAENLVPNNPNPNMQERIYTETLQRWAHDYRIRKGNSTIIVIAQNFFALSELLRSSSSGITQIRIPMPGIETRQERWQHCIDDKGAEFSDLTAKSLALITNGLSVNAIDYIYQLAKYNGEKIDMAKIRQEKEKVLQAIFGERIEIKVPKRGFDYYGGRNAEKKCFLKIKSDILRGMTRRVPTGIVLAGPPGTGKSYFIECVAYELGFIVVIIRNPRNMYVGKSEEIFAAMLAMLDDIGPAIVFEDEADQSEPPRGSGGGDSGTTDRIRQMKFEFCGDEARRGKIIWIRATNRVDLLDSAYTRDGRTDEVMPFLIPTEASEYAEILPTVFKRRAIPTEITDWMPFAEKMLEKKYIAQSSVDGIARKADALADDQSVKPEHLFRAIEIWKSRIKLTELARQTALAIEIGSEEFLPVGWEKILQEAKDLLKKEGLLHLI